MQTMTEIRLEILKNEGEGYSKAETVKNISDKLHVSRQDVYYHYNIRDKWQKDFIDFQNIPELKQTLVSRLNHIYRECSFQYIHADNSNAKVGALRLMMDATMNFAEFLPKDATFTKTPDEITISWQGALNAEVIKRCDELIKWSREVGETRHLVEVVDPDLYTPSEKETLDNAYRIIREKNPVEQKESLH